MKCYLLGTGVSRSVGYPLGSQLFDEIDSFVSQGRACFDRFDYQNDWNRLHRWLENNPNPTLSQAYRTKNIEHLFTALDFADQLRDDALLSAFQAERASQTRS